MHLDPDYLPVDPVLAARFGLSDRKRIPPRQVGPFSHDQYRLLNFSIRYQGDMNRQKRDQAVRVFMAKDKASIMLMSLKCGGVCLNLTRANRVISIDLGWSEAVES